MSEKVQNPILIFDPASEVKKAIAVLEKQQKMINYAMVAVVGVVALGFIAVVSSSFAIFIDHQNYAAERYASYMETLSENGSVR